MRYRNLHSWNVSPAEATKIQEDLREQIVVEKSFENKGKNKPHLHIYWTQN